MVALRFNYVIIIARGDPMKKYTALIIDLKKSRSYSVEDRNSIQKYIISVIRSLNEVFADSITRDIEFSSGDEVQGLFLSPESAFLYFRIFKMLVFPVRARAGIGIGEWNVIIENASITAQDGPVFHNARYAIESAKDALGYSVLFYSGGEVDLFLNSIINTSFVLASSHNIYHNELMLLLELLCPIDYRQLINQSKINLIFNLAASRRDNKYYKKIYRKSKSIKRYPFDYIDAMNFKPTPIEAIDDNSILYVSSGRKRGVPVQLSEILNISRQSVDKTIKTANIYEIRNLTIAALKFMDKFL
jgi:hypothetical protein